MAIRKTKTDKRLNKGFRFLNLLEGLMNNDMPQCYQIKQILRARREDYKTDRNWALINRTIIRRAKAGLRKARRLTMFSVNRPFPPQYVLFVEIVNICKDCGIGDEKECPFLASSGERTFGRQAENVYTNARHYYNFYLE